MRARQVTLAAFKKRRRRLLLTFIWTLFSCCIPQLYQVVYAIQGDSNSSPTELYAPPRAQHSLVMDNLRLQMGRIHSSSYQRQLPQDRMAVQQQAAKAKVASTFDASHVIIAPQLINEQSVANIRFKLSLMEGQIKAIYALLDGLTHSPEKTFKLSEVESVAPELKPDINMNPLQYTELDHQPNQEIQQNVYQQLPTNGIISDQEGESTPVVAISGSRPIVRTAGTQDPVLFKPSYSGGSVESQGGKSPQVDNPREQFKGESTQFSGPLSYQESGLDRLSGVQSDNNPQVDPVSTPADKPPTGQLHSSSFSKPLQMQMSAEASPGPIVVGGEQSQDQNYYNRAKGTSSVQATGLRGQERVDQEPEPINMLISPLGDQRPFVPLNEDQEYNQKYQQLGDGFSEKDDLNSDITRPVKVKTAVSGVRSYNEGRNEQYQDENINNLSWNNQEQIHELDESNQQEGEEQEPEQQRGGGRRKRKKHRLREAVIKGAKIAKDVATVSIHKAQQYSPVVDAVARKVQEHVVPVVNEAIEDGKEVVHGVSQGIKRSRRRRKAQKKGRKSYRKVSVVANDGVQADLDLERGVPDMLGAYPNIPPEVDTPNEA